MQVDDTNWSAYWYERGRNMVWRDVARHRSDSTMLIGEHVRAEPYVAPYQLASSVARCLSHLQRPILPAPGERSLAPRARADDRAVRAALVVAPPCQDVLFRPLVELAVSVSRLPASRRYWYASPLRARWADDALDRAAASITRGRCMDAATLATQVWATMLPGFILTALSPAELDAFRRAWLSLRELVDERAFLGLLFETLGARRNADRSELTIESLRTENTLRMSERVGPLQLQLAEEIARVEHQILAIEESIADGCLPVGANISVEFLPIAPQRLQRVRLVGDAIEFRRPREGRSDVCMYAWWVIDRSDGRLKALRLRSAWCRAIQKIIASAQQHGCGELPDLTIRYNQDRYCEPGMPPPGLSLRWEWSEPGEALTRRQLADVEAVANRASLEAYYNGRETILTQLDELRERRDMLARQFETAAEKRDDDVLEDARETLMLNAP